MPQNKINRKGQRQEQRFNQQNLIIEKSKALFRKVGYQKASVRMIAKECNFTVSNLYNYFNSKESILYQIHLKNMQDILDSVQKIDPYQSPTDVLREFIFNNLSISTSFTKEEKFFEFRKNDFTKTHRKILIQMRDQYENKLRDIIKQGIEKKEFRQVDVNLISMSILQMLTRIASLYSPKGRLSFNEVAGLIYEFILNGLRASEKMPSF